MDAGRQADLKRIDKRMATRRTDVTTTKRIVGLDPASGKAIVETEKVEVYNQKLDKWGKDQAGRARDTIIRQSKDKKLTRLRERLMRASRAHDKEAEVKISAEIKRHEGKPFEDYR